MKDNAAAVLKLIETKKSAYWSKVQAKTALELFHSAVERVPAYQDFLKKHQLNPSTIKTASDLQLVPPMGKQSYLRAYPLTKLVWDDSLNKPITFTATSGSTGEPFYFPREHHLDWQYSILAELFLKHSSHQTNGPVLVIVGFGMGVWIGGLITYKAFETAGRRGQIVSIITPGINKAEIFHALEKLSPHFAETILIGYPPFLKDLFDEAEEKKLDLKKFKLRILSAAEAYNEKFRDYLADKAGIKNIYRDMLNIYGTADLGAMAWETPLTIWLRREALKDKELFTLLFGNLDKIPTLAQYNPLFVSFEADQGNVLLTGNNTVPLIRYAVGDHGGVMNFTDVEKRFKSLGRNLRVEFTAAGLGDCLYELPFVYVYERSDFSTKLYGAIVYPEPVREALQADTLAPYLTGKFTLITHTNSRHNQELHVHVELKKNQLGNARLKKQCIDLITKQLLLKNAEYRNNHSMMAKRVKPKVIFWPYNHPKYFLPGIKQKWVRLES